MGAFQLTAAYQSYVWGGDRIAKIFHRKNLPKRVAESWEVSDRIEGMSKIAGGLNAGKTLHTLLQEMKEALIGKGRDFRRFPLLIKIIDAKENLSIQVHPSNGEEAKTECWVALAPSAVFNGFNQSVNQTLVETAIRENTLSSLLHHIQLQTGDAVFVPAGTIHAILAGSLLLEVQQNSNTTYRLYDWGRLGTNGHPRELHLKQGLEALCYAPFKCCHHSKKLEEAGSEGKIWRLIDSPYFQVRRFEIRGEMELALSDKSFQILFVEKGEGEMICDAEPAALILGTSWLIAASSRQCRIYGQVTLVVIQG